MVSYAVSLLERILSSCMHSNTICCSALRQGSVECVHVLLLIPTVSLCFPRWYTYLKSRFSCFKCTFHALLQAQFFSRGDSRLQTLNLSDNKILDMDLSAFSSALCDDTRLQKLDLSRNFLGDKAATDLGRTLQTNSTISHLDLSHNRILHRGVFGCMAVWACLLCVCM